MQPCCEPGGIGATSLDRSRSSAVDSRLPQSGACGGFAHAFGREILTNRPPISLFSAEDFPPHARTELSTMAMPRPVPPVSRVRDLSGRWNGSNNFGSSSFGTPGPLSSTIRFTVSFDSVAEIRTAQPSPAWRWQFRKTFCNALASNLRSAFAASTSGTAISTLCPHRRRHPSSCPPSTRTVTARYPRKNSKKPRPRCCISTSMTSARSTTAKPPHSALLTKVARLEVAPCIPPAHLTAGETCLERHGKGAPQPGRIFFSILPTSKRDHLILRR